MSLLQENLQRVRLEIADAARKAGRKGSDVMLVAVSKRKPSFAVQEALELGQQIFGENYVQEAADKIDSLKEMRDRMSWHFIGHLQRNKVRMAVELFDFIEAVDSLKLLRAISRHAAGVGRIMPVLLQVNIADERTKSGIATEGMFEFLDLMLREQLPGVDVQGLMVLPPWSADPQDSRKWFAMTRRLFDTLRERYGRDLNLRHLSMGMSGDFGVAVEEGATIVRIGTALFGPRT